MPYTADNWPIAAALLQFPSKGADGVRNEDADPSVWEGVFQEVKEAGFSNVDLFDTWIHPGDLSADRLDELKRAADNVGIGAPARGYYVAVPAPLETGVISYREAFKTALSFGFQGIICTEHYGGDGLSVSASNQDYLRNKILPKTEDYVLGESLVAQGRQQPVHAAR